MSGAMALARGPAARANAACRRRRGVMQAVGWWPAVHAAALPRAEIAAEGRGIVAC